MNGFDRQVLATLNQHARQWPTLDALVLEMSRNDALKGGVTLGCLWWAWFKRRADLHAVRVRLLATLCAGFFALVAGRVLTLRLPFRVRPLHNPGLHFVLPVGMGGEELRTWSSFPSDHAMLFTALATGMFCISPRGGTFLLLWTAFVIALPRVYLGLHYPTDVLGGAVIGSAIALLFQLGVVRRWIERHLLSIEQRRPGAFYAMMFLATFQIATMFDDLRALIQLAMHALRKHG